MEPVVELPDAELVLVEALSSLIPAHLVTWELPKGERFDQILATKAIIDVTRIGGSVKYRKAWDEPYVDFDVYALSKTQASDVMKLVRKFVESLKNSSHDSAVIGGVYEEAGPVTRPESNPAVTRVGCTYRFMIRPN